MNPYLKKLPIAVAKAIVLLDAQMELPSTEQRGKDIAKILNSLEMTNDAVLHFGLGYGFKKIENLKKKLSNQ